MGKFNASVTINCPIQTVFDFLNDQQNYVDLNPHNFRDYHIVTTERVGVGVQSEFVLKSGVFQEAALLKVITSESPNLIIEEGYLSDNPFRTIWKLNSLNENQTELDLTTEYQINGAVLLFKDKIQRAFERIYKRLLTDIVTKLNALS